MKLKLTVMLLSLVHFGFGQSLFHGADSIEIISVVRTLPLVEKQVEANHKPQWNEWDAYYEKVVLSLQKRFLSLKFQTPNTDLITSINGYTVFLKVEEDYSYRKYGQDKPVTRKYLKIIQGDDYSCIFCEHYEIDPVTLLPLNPPVKHP